MTNGKYTWINKDMDIWLKEQAKSMRKKGFNMDTKEASKLLVENILKPSNIELSSLIMIKKVKIRKKNVKKAIINERWGKKKISF